MFGRLTEWFRRGASEGLSAEIVSSFEDDDRPVHRYRAEGPHEPDGRADVLIRQNGRDLAILRFDEGVGEGDHPDAAFVLCEVHPQAQHLVFVSFGLGYVVDLNDLDHWRQLGAGWIGSFYDRQTQVMLLFSSEHVAGLCADGRLWQTPPLGRCGFRDTRLEDGVLRGQALSKSGMKRYPFEVDLRHGTYRGGAPKA